MRSDERDPDGSVSRIENRLRSRPERARLGSPLEADGAHARRAAALDEIALKRKLALVGRQIGRYRIVAHRQRRQLNTHAAAKSRPIAASKSHLRDASSTSTWSARSPSPSQPILSAQRTPCLHEAPALALAAPALHGIGLAGRVQQRIHVRRRPESPRWRKSTPASRSRCTFGASRAPPQHELPRRQHRRSTRPPCPSGKRSSSRARSSGGAGADPCRHISPPAPARRVRPGPPRPVASPAAVANCRRARSASLRSGRPSRSSSPRLWISEGSPLRRSRHRRRHSAKAAEAVRDHRPGALPRRSARP